MILRTVKSSCAGPGLTARRDTDGPPTGHPEPPRQLFVARSRGLCMDVRQGMPKHTMARQRGGGGGGRGGESKGDDDGGRFESETDFHYMDMDELLGQLEMTMADEQVERGGKGKGRGAGAAGSAGVYSVKFKTFEQNWLEQKAYGTGCTIPALTVWTEIQTVIKGSIAAFETGQPLTLDEYLKVGKRGSKLGEDVGLRRELYEAFKRSHKERNGL